MERIFFVMASLLGGLSVALGAFGAHALRDRLDPGLLANYQTGVTYMFFHALALFAVVMAVEKWPSSSSARLVWMVVRGRDCLLLGESVPDGLHGPALAGRDHPIGGVAFIVGWLLLAWVAWRG